MPISNVNPYILFAWRGSSLLITDLRGDCGEAHPLTGYYFREVRFLNTLHLEVDRRRPWLCEAAAVDMRTLEFAFIYPEQRHFRVPLGGATERQAAVEDVALPERALDVRVRYQVDPHRLQITAVVANRSGQPLSFSAGWRIGVDFGDFLDLFNAQHRVDAEVHASHGDRHASFRYLHPQLPFESTLLCEGPGEWTTAIDRLETRLSLQPQQSATVNLTVLPRDTDMNLDDGAAAERERRLSHWTERATRILMPQSSLEERITTRAVDDLMSLPLLEGDETEWLVPQAGLPRFPAMFGRDALTTGWQAAMIDCGEMLDSALTMLARLQATERDTYRDAEPGRIAYQLRRSPAARLAMTPEGLSYADFASSLMYPVALAHLYAWTGDRTRVERHWDTVRRALDWARHDGDRDRDGYLEYQTVSPQGPRHQGWKDSERAVVYEDGREVPAPVATCELQGYWFAALQLTALMSALLGRFGDARAYWAEATGLKERFNRDWWIEEEGFYALALDPDKRPVRSVASNVGHCLAAGIVNSDRLARVVGRLFAPDMFSGWGIRTLSNAHPAFHPLSYHVGSVWPVENATIAFGLRRYGFDARALDIAHALFQLAERYPEYRVPECVGGYPRGTWPSPGAFPISDPLQAWNVSAFPLLVHTILALQPFAPGETLFVDPALPPWLPEIVLSNLRIAGAIVSLRFIRDESGESTFEVLQKRGTLRVVRQPPPESQTAGFADRLSGLFESLT